MSQRLSVHGCLTPVGLRPPSVKHPCTTTPTPPSVSFSHESTRQGCVVNGDCYWLACREPKETELLWLMLAVGNSKFIESFYDKRFHNKLYAGRRRFMTQYVEKFPLPDPKTKIAQSIIKTAKNIYDLSPSSEAETLEKKLDKLVWQAFGLRVEERVG